VVHIHGGPHVRSDNWGPLGSWGVKEAQILASRGYAVVLPNFRMTPGLGSRIYNSGWGEYGRKMSDDHEDAARWAVQQGFADPGRICISGSSYGGSASLWASIRSADVFRCASAGLSVSDKHKQLSTPQTDYSSSDSGVDHWKRILGVKGDDWSRSDEVAPAQHAGRSAIPLFIWAGAADRRTPLSETERMVEALTKAGKPPEIVMIKADEGHGYGKRENQIELYEAMLRFLDRHIGPGGRAASTAGGAPAAP
jgi:dipeptidyl aminopeptidase/acylaminoacyl peptidase